MAIGDFKRYLSETSKQYDFIIKLAGDLSEDIEDNLEIALKKYGVDNLSSGKKTPIQKLPLDFPDLNNMEVTVFETTLNYPCTPPDLRFYLSDVLNIQNDHIRVRKPGEPYEEYQAEQEDTTYESKLLDCEYKYDTNEVNKDDLVVTEKGKESFLQQLAKEAKDRYKEEG
jgi:hypothetical protein